MSRVATRVLPAVLVIFLASVVAWAGFRGVAGWHFQAADTITRQMIDSGESTQAQIDEGSLLVNKALGYSPNNPDFLDLAGRLEEFKADQPGVVGKANREALESAAEYYRSALSVRPLWPYSWVNLLTTKDKLGQVDMEFNRALNRVMETGPWEPGVQLQVLSSGLHRWEQLKSEERGLVRMGTSRLLKLKPREVFSIVRSYGRPDLVCDEDTVHLQISRWCARVLNYIE